MAAGSHAESAPYRIAVIDDDVRIVKAVVRIAERAFPSVECRTASDGFTAGVLISTFRPHLVFLDIVMPGLSGIDVCKHIRGNAGLSKTAVVILSGHLTEARQAELEAAGVERIINKPLNPRDIERALDDLVFKPTSNGIETPV